MGCSKEDIQMKQGFLFVEKKPRESVERSDSHEKMKNGCCKDCMKAFSSIKRV
jgi:hypothetical protein